MAAPNFQSNGPRFQPPSNRTVHDKLLLQKLDAFTIGKKDVALDFKARLARENGWDQVFAARVIHEYKRFVFMAVR